MVVPNIPFWMQHEVYATQAFKSLETCRIKPF